MGFGMYEKASLKKRHIWKIKQIIDGDTHMRNKLFSKLVLFQQTTSN